jgi:hypothetical protein
MNCKVMGLAVGFSLLALWLAAAQDSQPVAGTRSLVQQNGLPASGRGQQIYEDIEILRRILDQTLRRMAGQATTGTAPGHGMPGGSPLGENLTGDLASQWLALGEVGRQPDNGVRQLRLCQHKDGSVERIGVLTAEGAHHGLALLETSASLVSNEGTYLRGYGVVYSISLPVVAQETVKESDKPAPRPLSQWERTRQELRGETVATESKGRTPKEDTVADAVLKVLAENGRHFSRLPENEQLTVAITLRPVGSSECAKCHQFIRQMGAAGSSGMGRLLLEARTAMPGMSMSGDMAEMTVMGQEQQRMGQMMGGTKNPSLQDGGPGKGHVEKALDWLRGDLSRYGSEIAKLREEAQNHVLLGDLHTKQKRIQDAVAAYQKALEVYQKFLDKKREADQQTYGKPIPDGQSSLGAMELYTKLAQSYLANGQTEEALAAFRKIQEISKAYEAFARSESALGGGSLNVTRPGNVASSIPLPSKLIISVPERLLRQGSGDGDDRISWEEFKKGTTVEFVRFATPKENPAAPGTGDKPQPAGKGGSGGNGSVQGY